jgi:hypothetical protein
MTTKELVLLLHEKLDEQLKDHEDRIRLLERFRWALPASVGTTLIAAVSAAAIVITNS